MANTYLTRTISDGSNTKSTYSAWIKRSGISGTQYLWHTSENSSNDVKILFNSGDFLRVLGVVSGSTVMELTTNRKFRDTSAWYHVVVSFDTTQGTASNRVKIYINGVQETSFSTATYPAEDYASLRLNNSGDRRTIGTAYDNGGSAGNAYWNGSMSHVYWIDGTAYAASTFGSTDSTTGEWKINTSPSVTMGTNGFTILKDGNTITDQSSNSNNFALGGGTLTKTEDCPDNVFCVLNFLDTTRGLSNGNTTFAGASSGTVVKGSLGMSSGKYYAECKILSAAENMIGVLSIAQAPSTVYVGASAVGWGLFGDGTLYNNSSATSNFSNSFSDNDIMGIALDMDNNKLYFSKNGVFQNSGDPTSGSTGTGAVSITSGLTMTFCGGRDSSSDTANFNFGNGYFGTTAISSEGSNASGIGKFEYDVPTGFTALSTKGLNE